MRIRENEKRMWSVFSLRRKTTWPFLDVILPITLLGAGEEWTMMRNISVTEYSNFEAGKFSKSRSTGVFGIDAMETGISADVWRRYILANRPKQQDTDLMWINPAFKSNDELLKNLDTRGDQFGSCGAQLNPTESIEPKCLAV
ncbi:hypothetical protein BSKO_09783 [Bryopsis sp. KO-2023]|nr:hypothetical protein BSKO_09783 [Bryopsis sp. KO-2023]